MPDYNAQVFVCTYSDDAEDRQHCGGKGGPSVRQKFNELIVQHKFLEAVSVSNVGCTSQHKFCDSGQGNVIVFGPGHTTGVT